MKHKALKIGAYARVSHDEQKKYGYSIQAQIEKLSKWCDDEKHQLVDMFVDEGYTAGNMKRPKLLEMLDRLNEFDVIIFTRLDRFSRNVLEANKMLELLQKHNVALISIEEDDIDTSTADGMFMFQLKVSLAERELRKGSERIKSVFEYKIKAGQPVSGSLPMGYKIGVEDNKKKVVLDEEYISIVEDIFRHFAKHQSVRQTMEYTNKKYGLNRGYLAYNRILKNPLYTGIYKGNKNYCTPYISCEDFVRNQELIKKNIRIRKSNNVYLFTSLIRCPRCGGSFVGGKNYDKRYNRTYYSYRCIKRYTNKACSFDKSISENNYIEPYLLNNIDKLVNDYIYRVTELKPIKINDVKKRIKDIKDDMEKLNYMFMKKRIETNDYDRQYEALENEIKQLQKDAPKEADISHLKDFLNSGWRNIYESLNRENKRTLWRNIIKEIIIDEDFNIDIIFL